VNERDDQPSFLAMVGLVALVVAIVILDRISVRPSISMIEGPGRWLAKESRQV